MLIRPEAIQAFKEYEAVEKELRQLWDEYQSFLFTYVKPGSTFWRWSRSTFIKVSAMDDVTCEITVQNENPLDTDEINFGWEDIHATSAQREKLWRNEYKDLAEFNFD